MQLPPVPPRTPAAATPRTRKFLLAVALACAGTTGCALATREPEAAAGDATVPEDGHGLDADAATPGLDGEPGSDSSPSGDTAPTPDSAPITDAASDSEDAAAPPPECTAGGGECGASRGCLAGRCRDKCVAGFYCGGSKTGPFCQGGLCVECRTAADCPGSRYLCDPASWTCKDKPFDPTKTKIGIFYHTWHCPSAAKVYDLTEILAGKAPYGPYNASHWWGKPTEGYYCLSKNDLLLAKHAQQLRDMGVDFVFVDVTNHAYNSNALNDRPVEMILEPFARMVEVWSGVTGAPRIVPWVPVVATDAAHPKSTHMVFTLLDMLGKKPGLQFVYAGKPLVLVTENATYPVDESKVTELSPKYTLRRMWAGEAVGSPKWSYMERCQKSPLDAAPCKQRSATLAGAMEQLPIASAYQADYMSHPSTATPKHKGKTFRKQFETLFDNPEVPIATITGWNEWVVGRLQCDKAPLCKCSNPEDVNGCFLDQYDVEYDRDLEPGANPMGDYYYRLAKACIALFRSGARCDAAHATDVCCKDY